MMLALALSGLTVGCQSQVGEQSWTTTQAGDRTVTFRELEGELGGHALNARGLPGASWRGEQTEIVFDAFHSRGYASLRINTDIDLFEPGMRSTLLTQNEATVHGVAGSDTWDIDFDGYADEVEIEVFDGAADDTRRVDLTAVFGRETIRASVLLDLVAEDVDDSLIPDVTEPWDTYEPPVEGNMVWDTVQTDLGPGADRSLNDIAGTMSDYGDGSQYMRIDTTVGGRWTMFALSYTEDANGEAQNPDVLGCVGPTPGDYDYDGHADQVSITFEPGELPGERIGTLDATFNEYRAGEPSYLHATFRYNPR